MTDEETVAHYKDLPRGMANWMICPVHVGMMCGAKHAKQTNTGKITLTYTDDTEESALSGKDLQEFDSFFSIVSFVQSKRT